jgi:hypothetical protein
MHHSDGSQCCCILYHTWNMDDLNGNFGQWTLHNLWYSNMASWKIPELNGGL